MSSNTQPTMANNNASLPPTIFGTETNSVTAAVSSNQRRPSATFLMATKSSESRKFEIASSKNHASNENQSNNIPTQSHIPLKVTKPISPKFRTNSRLRGSKEKQLTSEELELLKIEQEKQEHKERLEKIKRLFEMNKVKTGESIAMQHIHSTKEPTIPTTPMHNLTQRLGRKENHNDMIVPQKLNLDSHNNIQQQNGPKKPTIPQPFQFKSDARAMSANRTRKELSSTSYPTNCDTEANVTVAELNNNFLKDARHIDVSVNACKKLTIAQAPKFETDKRSNSRPKVHVKSLEDMETELMEKMKSMQFKAKPVPSYINHTETNEKCIHHVKENKPKPVIEFKPFHFKTDERMEQRKQFQSIQISDIRNNYDFKALPMPNFSEPSTISGGIASARDYKPKVTVPVSPKLHGGGRASSAPPVRQKPHHSILEKQRLDAKNFVPKKITMHITEPKEFHLQSDDRGSLYRAMMAEKLKRDEESLKAKREYHAQPVPVTIFRKPLQVKMSDKELTEFREFKLKSIARHEHVEEIKKIQLKEIENQIHQQTEFHAKPVPKTTYEPEVINPSLGSEKELVVPVDVKFESDKRIESRKIFDAKMKEKLMEIENQKKHLEDLKIQNENKEIQELRTKPIQEGGMKFIAQPIIREDLYPSKHVQAMPLTEPKSPQFSQLRSRSSSVSSMMQQQLDMM